MDKRQKNNLMTLLTLIVVLGQFILWIMLLLLDKGSCAYYKPCADISMCKICFLNANNYLNVLKYIKHNKNKFPLTSTL